jgi:hypothetical protein
MFLSFELLKENHEITEEAGRSECNGTALHGKIVISKEDQQPSYALNDHVADYMEGYFNSDLQPVLNYQLENEDEVDQEIIVGGYFPSPELNKDLQQNFQQDKVFQSCLSSPMNEVIVKFLSGLDMDEDLETAFIEISNSERKTDIEFQERNKTVYVTFQSEIQEDDEEAVVLFDLFENHGFENASMGTLERETVHVVSFPHLQEYYEQELTPLHSLVSQSNSPRENFQKVNKPKPELFDEQEDSLDTHNRAVVSKYFQECMHVFFGMHGRVSKPIACHFIWKCSQNRKNRAKTTNTYERGLSFYFSLSRRNGFS